MASKINRILGQKYTVTCIPQQSTSHRRRSWPLDSADSGIDVPTEYGKPKQEQPNRYRLAGRELSITGFAPFHTFDVLIHPNGDVDVLGSYPHRGPLGGLSKLIAFCEVGPHTEVRTVLIQETLDDAIAGGIISYISTVDEEEAQDDNVVNGNKWTRDGGHNHLISLSKFETKVTHKKIEKAAKQKERKGSGWAKDGEHNHLAVSQ